MKHASLATAWSNLEALGSADFMILPDRRHSYADLANAVGRVCALFDADSLSEGDRIIISSRDDFASVAVFISALFHGIVPTLLSPETRQGRARAIASDIDCTAVFADPELIDDWGLNAPCHTIAGPPAKEAGWFGFSRKYSLAISDLPERGVAPRLPATDDSLAYLLFTSGTTQSPTGVQITRRNIIANTATISRIMNLNRGDRLFNDMLLAHADGLVQGPILAMTAGASVIRAGGFAISRMEDWLNTVRREGATHFITVPTVWAMIDHYATHDDYFDAPEMRLLMSCAAKLDNALWTRIEERFGKPLGNEYGLTETVMSALYAGPCAEMGARGTIGKPIDCDARLDPETSELQLRGENIFPGYWRNETRTAESFTPDGWLRTGDIARRTPDGSFEYLGRIKAAINSGGLLIRPEEIDEALVTHPAVLDAATVGLPDPEFGEIAVSAVELRGEATEDELTDHARQMLEHLKVPKRIVALEKIPRGDAGKARLQELRSLLADRLSEKAPTHEGPPVAADVVEIAARIFRCDQADLTRQSTPDTVAGWDSFNQMSLFLAVEERFGVRLPTRSLAALRKLGDLIDLVAGSKA